MKQTILFIVFFYSAIFTKAQINLVRNPSLEKHQNCASGVDQIILANYWSPILDTFPFSYDSLGSNNCSPEYCNSCNIGFGIPHGWGFWHYARTGNAMAEVQMFANQEYFEAGAGDYKRDYLQGRLYKRLTLGNSYCVSFYVSIEYTSAWAINHIGAYLDDGTIDTVTLCGLPQTSHSPQVYVDSIISGLESDSLSWVKIEGSFIATGNESFITIGNFFDSTHTAKIPTGFIHAIGSGNDVYSWYLVDDVSVIRSDDTADAGVDRFIPHPTSDSVWVGDTTADYLPCYWYRHTAGTTGWVLIDSNISGFKVHPDTNTGYVMQLTVCGHTTTDTMTVLVGPVSVRGARAGAEVALYPNPAGNEVTVEGVRGCEVHVLDMVGRCLIMYSCREDIVQLPLAGLEKGMYFVEVVDVETGIRVVRKMVKS